MKARYINPYTDFGFKKLFGEEAGKDLLVDFLNQLLPARHTIVNLTFKPPEQLTEITSSRRAIFDIFCRNENGERFIVEMQKAKIKFFKDRTIFYTTFPIREQAEKGEWNFKLNPVYCVALLDFMFEDDREQKNHISHVQLKDQYCQTFYDKLVYIFIEMPRFTKEEDQLETHFDKWLYFLKHLEDFENIPAILNEEVFVKAFEIAEIANFDRKQIDQYEESLKIYRDLKGVIDTSFEDGQEKGKEEGIKIGEKIKAIKIAKQMKAKGMDIDSISEMTELSKEEIEKL
ncbi:MAG: Rpn family recombination-promoting nuclease/putative transposase [bacterium]|nr:Rpn family recombination-promoting nuclease/putative transposase [bacterium]